ncbi:hypothetical protein ABPG72_018842 [Tetrahymena utriculariae]
MFGNSLTYYNIFGNAIQESHQRLFGGDRMLTTKDIEGAQPKKYNRHVWGNYQANQYQNILSYDPQKSVIKSPILGDNVQPLNRAIPNSSGTIFRDPQYQSLTQKLYTQQSVRSPQQKLDLAQSTQNVLAQPYEKPSNNIHSQSYTGLKKDNNNLLDASSPAVKQLSHTSQRISGRRIEPPSQLKEQNIFSHPDYVNKQLSTYAKPMVNVGNQPQSILSQSKQSLGVVQKVDQNRIVDRIQTNSGYQSLQALNNVLKSNRSPDAYIPFEPTPKEYQRESISSYALGQNKDVAIEKYLQQNRDKYYEQPSKSPLFQQNRNFGPDHVLSGPISVENRQSTSSYEFGSFVSPKQKQNEQQDVISPKQGNYINENNTLPLSNRINQKDQQSYQVNQVQQEIPQIQSVQNQDNTVSQKHLQEDKNEFNKINSQQKIQSRPQSNTQLLGRPASNNNQLTKSFTQLRNDAAASPSQDLIRLRSVLSSRARLLLNQNQNEATTNSKYGLYAAQPNRIDQPKEKILYQSKRDNFLRSHLVRSQSAEGTRLLKNIAENNQQNQDQASQVSKQQNGYSQLFKYGQWGLRNYNIIGNYMNPYKYEGRRRDPFADIKYLGKQGNNKIQSVKNLNSELKNDYPLNVEQVDTQQQQELRKSGYPSSPLAGVQNQYDETNKKFNALYHSQRAQDQHSVKYYGAKALKNLSNIKLY